MSISKTPGPDRGAHGPSRRDPIELVKSYIDAIEDRDLDRARDMQTLSFVMQVPGVDRMRSLGEMANWAALQYRYVRKAYDGFDICQGDPLIVYMRGTLNGEWARGGLFSGIRFLDRFELKNGLIQRHDMWNALAEARKP